MATMMKTPDEIKKGLEHCSDDGCKHCPYVQDCNMADGFSVLAYDALAYIWRLEAERDQAVKDCSRFMCETCAEHDNGDNCSWCSVVDGCRNGYVWRGLPEPPKEDAHGQEAPAD